MPSKSLHPVVLGLLLSSLGFGCSGQPAPQSDEKSPSTAQTAKEPASEPATPKEPPSPAEPKVVEEKKEPKPFSKLNPEEEKVIVVPHLKPGEELAHAVFKGPFGPASDTVLVVTQSEEKGQKSFGGFALVWEPGGHRRIPLPAFGEWNAWEISAILLDNLDEDADREPIIMASYMTGVGPEGAVPFYSNVVLDWDGSAFVRNAALEEKVKSLETAAEIRKALKE